MKREELLQKLAMELAEWPLDSGQARRKASFCEWVTFNNGDDWKVECPGFPDITEKDWLAERERLINKPRWEDAPEWAQWLAQDEDGEWKWYSVTPNLFCDSYGSTPYSIAANGVVLAGHRWQDTLERRPEPQPYCHTLDSQMDAPRQEFADAEDVLHSLEYEDDHAGELPCAASFLRAGLGHMESRAATYDAPGGERSMGKTVAAFNALTGHELTEAEGWLLMGVLKMARSTQGAFKADNYEDLAAYAGLAGEAAAKESDK